MEGKFLQKTEDGNHKIYDSILVDPEHLNILGNKLTQEIIKKLSTNTLCAMDIARDLKQHEQKIYYHLRNLEKAGIIKKVGTEKRAGMIAKMFTATSPIVSTKLYEEGYIMDDSTEMQNIFATSFFHPFINNGNLDAKVVLGDTYAHGRFDSQSKEGNFIFDLALLLGSLVRNFNFPYYKLDTEITSSDLKNNLILIGNSKTNTIIDRLNSNLPFYFDEKKDFSVASRITGKSHDDQTIGMVLKIPNPFNNTKKILILGGKLRATRTAILACTIRIKELLQRADKDGNVMCFVKGLDKDGDKIIDEVKFI